MLACNYESLFYHQASVQMSSLPRSPLAAQTKIKYETVLACTLYTLYSYWCYI